MAPVAGRPGSAAPSSPARVGRWPLRASDLQGLARLGVDGTLGVTHLVEAMHRAILSGGLRRVAPLADAPADPSQADARAGVGGVTGAVYQAVRGTTRAVGWGLDSLLGLLARPRAWPQDWSEPPAAAEGGAVAAPSAEREALLAVLNGVLGDHLAATANPLAITGAWRTGGVGLPADGSAWANRLPQATGRVLVMVHGLCMNDLQFMRRGHDHALALQRERGCTPVYWHYNSGLHVADNGQRLSAALGQLLRHWPVPVTELVLLGHSMGGLVLRSACHQAALAQAPWLAQARHLICLGTPHHGAPLERGGHLVDRALGLSPWVAPLARIGQVRSAGITDLRFGRVQWPAAERPGRGQDPNKDHRPPTPLPPGVACAVVAATTGPRAGGLRSATVGDGLVPLASALGRHRRPAMALAVPPERSMVLTQANHWDLLNRPEVTDQLLAWLR